MIIRRYLIKEIIKSQVAILFVLLVIFMSQKLIRILSSAISGDVPIDLIFSLLMLGLSDMFNLILPLSLFLGILIALVRLYNDSEMVVMFACGIKKRNLYQAAGIVAMLTGLLTIINVTWYGPWSGQQENITLQNAKSNPSAAGLLSGQFQMLESNNSVVYIGNINKNKLKQIFIYQTPSIEAPKGSVILSKNGVIHQDNEGNQMIQLNDALRYEGAQIANEFRISEFADYEAIIIPKTVELEESWDEKQQSLYDLYTSQHPGWRAEFWWRITLILSVPLLAYLVIPLSVSNPRHGKFSQMLPAILLYLIYFLAMSSVKANGSRERLDPELWTLVINGIFFSLAILFNIWDTAWMRKWRHDSALLLLPFRKMKKR